MYQNSEKLSEKSIIKGTPYVGRRVAPIIQPQFNRLEPIVERSLEESSTGIINRFWGTMKTGVSRAVGTIKSNLLKGANPHETANINEKSFNSRFLDMEIEEKREFYSAANEVASYQNQGAQEIFKKAGTHNHKNPNDLLKHMKKIQPERVRLNDSISSSQGISKQNSSNIPAEAKKENTYSDLMSQKAKEVENIKSVGSFSLTSFGINKIINTMQGQNKTSRPLKLHEMIDRDRRVKKARKVIFLYYQEIEFRKKRLGLKDREKSLLASDTSVIRVNRSGVVLKPTARNPITKQPFVFNTKKSEEPTAEKTSKKRKFDVFEKQYPEIKFGREIEYCIKNSFFPIEDEFALKVKKRSRSDAVAIINTNREYRIQPEQSSSSIQVESSEREHRLDPVISRELVDMYTIRQVQYEEKKRNPSLKALSPKSYAEDEMLKLNDIKPKTAALKKDNRGLKGKSLQDKDEISSSGQGEAQTESSSTAVKVKSKNDLKQKSELGSGSENGSMNINAGAPIGKRQFEYIKENSSEDESEGKFTGNIRRRKLESQSHLSSKEIDENLRAVLQTFFSQQSKSASGTTYTESHDNIIFSIPKSFIQSGNNMFNLNSQSKMMQEESLGNGIKKESPKKPDQLTVMQEGDKELAHKIENSNVIVKANDSLFKKNVPANEDDSACTLLPKKEINLGLNLLKTPPTIFINSEDGGLKASEDKANVSLFGASIFQKQPATSLLQNQPTSLLQNQPTTSLLQNQPTTSLSQNQPATSLLQNQPTASIFQSQSTKEAESKDLTAKAGFGANQLQNPSIFKLSGENSEADQANKGELSNFSFGNQTTPPVESSDNDKKLGSKKKLFLAETAANENEPIANSNLSFINTPKFADPSNPKIIELFNKTAGSNPGLAIITSNANNLDIKYSALEETQQANIKGENIFNPPERKSQTINETKKKIEAVGQNNTLIQSTNDSLILNGSPAKNLIDSSFGGQSKLDNILNGHDIKRTESIPMIPSQESSSSGKKSGSQTFPLPPSEEKKSVSQNLLSNNIFQGPIKEAAEAVVKKEQPKSHEPENSFLKPFDLNSQNKKPSLFDLISKNPSQNNDIMSNKLNSNIEMPRVDSDKKEKKDFFAVDAKSSIFPTQNNVVPSLFSNAPASLQPGASSIFSNQTPNPASNLFSGGNLFSQNPSQKPVLGSINGLTGGMEIDMFTSNKKYPQIISQQGSVTNPLFHSSFPSQQPLQQPLGMNSMHGNPNTMQGNFNNMHSNLNNSNLMKNDMMTPAGMTLGVNSGMQNILNSRTNPSSDMQTEEQQVSFSFNNNPMNMMNSSTNQRNVMMNNQQHSYQMMNNTGFGNNPMNTSNNMFQGTGPSNQMPMNNIFNNHSGGGMMQPFGNMASSSVLGTNNFFDNPSTMSAASLFNKPNQQNIDNIVRNQTEPYQSSMPNLFASNNTSNMNSQRQQTPLSSGGDVANRLIKKINGPKPIARINN